MLVKTYLDKSKIEGIGCFADEEIRYGELIENFNSIFYKEFSQFQVDHMHSSGKELIDKYSIKRGDDYYISCTNAKFINHSNLPNTYTKDGFLFALRDIDPDEEITMNYNEVCDEGVNFQINEDKESK